MRWRAQRGFPLFLELDNPDVIEHQENPMTARKRTGRKVIAVADLRQKAIRIAQLNPHLSQSEIASRLTSVTERQVQYWLAPFQEPTKEPCEARSKLAVRMQQDQPELSSRAIAERIGADSSDVVYWLEEHRLRELRRERIRESILSKVIQHGNDIHTATGG